MRYASTAGFVLASVAYTVRDAARARRQHPPLRPVTIITPKPPAGSRHEQSAEAPKSGTQRKKQRTARRPPVPASAAPAQAGGGAGTTSGVHNAATHPEYRAAKARLGPLGTRR